MSKSRSILQGAVNVPIQPSASADCQYTNNITITTNPESIEVKYPTDVKPSTRDIEPTGPYNNLVKESVSDYILKLYQTILLSQNKELLANLVSKNQIVLTKKDLERVIRLQIGKPCSVELEDPDATCCGISAPFLKIATIKVYDGGSSNGVDYTVKYNADYLDLVGTYRLCTKFVFAY